MLTSSFFFFQAEDGIRGRNVTGVQTCALPILQELRVVDAARRHCDVLRLAGFFGELHDSLATEHAVAGQIGRASCRERVYTSVGPRATKNKQTSSIWPAPTCSRKHRTTETPGA